MLNRFVLFFLILTFVVGFISCDDDPTSLGSNLLPDQDLINVFMINSIDSSFQQKSKFYDTDTLALSSSSKMFLGKNGNVESTMLMKFYMFFPDSIKEAILGDSLILNSAVIELEPIFTYGDENNTFEYTVHEITNDWNSLEFGKNEFELLTYNEDDISSNHQSVGDTSIIMSFDIDKDLVTNWLSLSANETQEENFGVYFNYSSATDKILGFPAISTQYDTVLTRLKMIVEVPGNFVDTLTVEVTSDAHVVLGEMPTSNNQNIFVQGGIPIRSDLFIDVSKIPDYSIINKATLKLFVDETESDVSTVPSDFIGVLLLNDYETSELNTSYAGILLDFDTLSYSGDITIFVQEWLSNGNNGMKLHLLDEVETVNKIAISGSEKTDITLRPYLEIIYTSKIENNE
ncbi:MAG: hypothetical protein PF445_12185 [Melioribacteraceae bacterium]|nr:hypothetical protein [Melioribacteraceae bacterium]